LVLLLLKIDDDDDDDDKARLPLQHNAALTESSSFDTDRQTDKQTDKTDAAYTELARKATRGKKKLRQ